MIPGDVESFSIAFVDWCAKNGSRTVQEYVTFDTKTLFINRER